MDVKLIRIRQSICLKWVKCYALSKNTRFCLFQSNKKSGDTEGKDNVLIPVLISLFATLIGLAILFICVYIHKKDKIIQLLKNHNFMKNSVAQQPSS